MLRPRGLPGSLRASRSSPSPCRRRAAGKRSGCRTWRGVPGALDVEELLEARGESVAPGQLREVAARRASSDRRPTASPSALCPSSSQRYGIGHLDAVQRVDLIASLRGRVRKGGRRGGRRGEGVATGTEGATGGSRRRRAGGLGLGAARERAEESESERGGGSCQGAETIAAITRTSSRKPSRAMSAMESEALQNPSNVKLGREPSYPSAPPPPMRLATRARRFLREHGRKLWWLHSAYALALGTGVVAFAQQGFDHARWLAVSLGLAWLLVVLLFRLFEPARRSVRAFDTARPEDAGALLRDDVRAQEPLPGDALLSPALLLEVDDARRRQRVVRASCSRPARSCRRWTSSSIASSCAGAGWRRRSTRSRSSGA